MNEKQINLIHWLYNFAINEMKNAPQNFNISDQVKLQEAIIRRFPEHADEITSQFDYERFN